MRSWSLRSRSDTGRVCLSRRENIHPDLIAFLRERGLDIVSVRSTRLVGASDIQVLEVAYLAGRVVLTHDRDFGSLAISAGAAVHGIVLSAARAHSWRIHDSDLYGFAEQFPKSAASISSSGCQEGSCRSCARQVSFLAVLSGSAA
jgi:predicted nuclease of predicted toxin-antitoxin system